MTLTDKQAFIVYCSPAGSTKHVAEVMGKKLKSLGTSVTVFDLGNSSDFLPIISQLKEARDNACLYIGSPVYASHAVPPVLNFISQLPDKTQGYAIPFVTWGGATSGIALWEMGKQLNEKGYHILGAAKILAVHSLMLQFDAPLGKGHPDSDDDKMIEDLVSGICKKLNHKPVKTLPLSKLAYQPPHIHEKMEKTSFESAKQHFPQKRLKQEFCTKCGICKTVCPAEAIILSPYPEFGPSCICCFNCVQFCPENAIEADLSILEERIKARAKEMDERPFTEIQL